MLRNGKDGLWTRACQQVDGFELSLHFVGNFSYADSISAVKSAEHV